MAAGGSSGNSGDQNGAFSSRGEFQIPMDNNVERDFAFDKRCTEAANMKIMEAGKDDQMANILLNLNPLGLKLSVSSILRDTLENNNQIINFEYSSQPVSEKLKAANFEVVFIKIGKWEKKKRNEGDIIAKCYFAKKKLVWEFLRGNLKSKIEIQWNDIIGIRANLVENKPGILEIELNKAPDFFEEIDPQPRKHTIWRVAPDFTGGEASSFRRHYLVFPPGLLDKHYQKLLLCDERLYGLSHGPFPSLKTLYFEQNNDKYLNFSSHHPPYQTNEWGSSLQFTSPIMATHPAPSFNQTSPVSVMDFSPSNEHFTSFNNVFDHSSMARPMVQDLTNHHNGYSNSLPPAPPFLPPLPSNGMFSGQANQDSNMVNCILTSLSDHLFSENQVEVCDEKYNMERIESLKALLDLSHERKEESSQFQQEVNIQNGSSFHEQTFQGHNGTFFGQSDPGQQTFYGVGNGLISSGNNDQDYEVREQVAVHRQPDHAQDSLIQQAWENLTDPTAKKFGEDIDNMNRFNGWR